jgi:hypothetical protein
MLYLRARFYSLDGRFLTRDTWQGEIIKPSSYNLWLYGYANPINKVDPSGKYPVCEPYEECNIQEVPFDPNKIDRNSLPIDGQAAYDGIKIIDEEDNAWWGKGIQLSELLQIYLRREFGSVYLGVKVVRQAVTRLFWSFCNSADPWSTQCLNGFWGYAEPIRDAKRYINEYKGYSGGPNKWEIYKYAMGVLNPEDSIWKHGLVNNKPGGWATVNNIQHTKTYTTLSSAVVDENDPKGVSYRDDYTSSVYVWGYPNEECQGDPIWLTKQATFQFVVLTPQQQSYHCGGSCLK